MEDMADADASFEDPSPQQEESSSKSAVPQSEQMQNYDHHTNDQPPKSIPYHAYSTEHDEVVLAQSLDTAEERMRLRQQLDDKMASVKSATKRKAQAFVRRLWAERKRTWHYHLEEGVLDPKKLTRIAVEPTYSEYYRHEEEDAQVDTVVTLLLDNSGSMRGRPIMTAALCADILAQSLESCDIKVEILGFTTAQWKGGKSRQEWERAGRPANPGRLNDLRHIVYKSADTPWRRARSNMGLMLKEGLLKENIDGEAVLWACERLSFRPEKRKILMVISDGAPVDDSTMSANNNDYLNTHLRQVIRMAEQRMPIELTAIGIGHDVTSYYDRAVTIRDVDQLGDTMFEQLEALFA
jgi:cobaltochelatase CobT